jgi:hypothetical protein
MLDKPIYDLGLYLFLTDTLLMIRQWENEDFLIKASGKCRDSL